MRLVALVLEWLDARVADILLSPTGISTSISISSSSAAATRMSDTLAHPVSEMAGRGTSSNNSGSSSSSSVADAGTNVVVELVDWFDQQISSLFGGSTSTGVCSNDGGSGSSTGDGGVSGSSGSSGIDEDRINAAPAPATPSPLGAGLVASLVESVLLGLGEHSTLILRAPCDTHTHTRSITNPHIHPPTHLLTHLPIHPLTGSDPSGEADSNDSARGARNEEREGSETDYPTLLR